MIPATLRTSLLLAVLVYFFLILLFLKNKALSLRYTLLWLFAGLIMGIMMFWPELFSRIIHFFGVESNMNGLFIMCIGFLMIILMSITSIVSRQRYKIKILTQELAILDKRIRDLETKLMSEGEDATIL